MADARVAWQPVVPVACGPVGSVYGLGWNLDPGGRRALAFRRLGRLPLGAAGGPGHPRLAVTVVATDDAAVALRRDFVWAELTRQTGLRRARVIPAHGLLRPRCGARPPGRGRGHSPYADPVTALLGPAEIRQLAARLGIRPTKTLGQNFVHDPNTVRRIVRTAELATDDVVIEVGPGPRLADPGAACRRAPMCTRSRSTRVLAAAAAATVAEHASRGRSRLTVHNRDALDLSRRRVEPAADRAGGQPALQRGRTGRAAPAGRAALAAMRPGDGAAGGR